MNLPKKKMILVTGCTGYLGFHICEYFKTKKIAFYGIDNFSRSSQKNIIDKEKFLKITFLLNICPNC